MGVAAIYAAGCAPADRDRSSAAMNSGPSPAVSMPTSGSTLYQKTLQERRAAVAANPADVSVRGRLAIFLHANDQFSEAAAIYEHLRTVDPADGRWPYYLARIRQDKGDVAQARALLDEALVRSPGYALIELRLADLDFKSGDRVSAEAGYRRFLAREPGSAHALLGLARLALQRQAWSEAEPHLLEAIAADPALGSSYALLATAYEAMGEAKKAAAVRARSGDSRRFREPDDPWFDALTEECCNVEKLCVLADIAIEAGQEERGVALLQRAKAIDPARARTRLALGKALQEAGQRTSALAELREATRQEPTLVEAHYTVAAALEAAGETGAALAAATEGMRHVPHDSGLHRQRGMLLQTLRRPAEAEDALRQAVTLDSGEVQNLEALGNFLWAHGRHPEAVAEFEKARALSRLAVKPRAILAGYYIESGKMRAAEACLHEAIEIDPTLEGLDDVRALFFLRTGNTQFRAGDMVAAERAYQMALDAKPTHEESWTGLVVLWQRTGRAAMARTQLEQFIRDHPQAVFAYELAARVALQAGDRAAGLGLIERGLARAREQSDLRQENSLRSLRARVP